MISNSEIIGNAPVYLELHSTTYTLFSFLSISKSNQNIHLYHFSYIYLPSFSAISEACFCMFLEKWYILRSWPQNNHDHFFVFITSGISISCVCMLLENVQNFVVHHIMLELIQFINFVIFIDFISVFLYFFDVIIF